MLRFASLLEHEFSKRGHSVRLIQPQPLFGKLGRDSSWVQKWFGYVDKFLIFPLQLRRSKKGFDVVHICDHSNSMYVRQVADLPHVVTCHDMLAIRSALGEIPQNPTSSTGKILQHLILRGLTRSRHIVCVSANTKTELLRITGMSDSKISVVPLGLSYPYAPMDRGPALQQLDRHNVVAKEPFFLHVGGRAWYKNRLGVLQIFCRLRSLESFREHRLVMIGQSLESSLIEFIASHGLNEVVSCISNIPNEDLRAAYSLATGLIFPSLQEGFGWPILEAQSCGCPVFTTNRAPMTEVGGTAATYFDPDHLEEAAQIISSALNEKNLRERSLMNASRFNLHPMIEGYLAAYSTAIGETTSRHPERF
jgi:glycosyltransferase involved in cell wall biosynthesis